MNWEGFGRKKLCHCHNICLEGCRIKTNSHSRMADTLAVIHTLLHTAMETTDPYTVHSCLKLIAALFNRQGI
jgi:hypothetical protein